MTLWKRVVGMALCLCLACTAVPMQTQAAPAVQAADEEVKPQIVIDDSKVHKEVLAKKDIGSSTYSAGRADDKSSAKYTVTNLTNGQRIVFTTDLNKLSELYIVPFTTSLEVPANTTCTVTQTFKFYGANQIATSNLAVAAASFQLLYLDGTTASGTTITPRTKSSSSYGSSKGTVLFGGSRYGKSNKDNGDYNTDRKITVADKTDKVLTLVYKNDTNTKKTISYNFVFWGSTQYAATYDNKFTIGFNVLYNQVTTEKVTFNANGGSVSPTSQTVTFGSAYGTLPTPTRTNYTFEGWYTAKTGGTRVTSTTTVDTFGGHTLYAHWTGKKSTVTFNANGGEVSPTSKTATYGDAYGTLPTPTRDNYDFAGWYTAKTGGTKVTETTTVTKTTNHTLYARWTGKQYTVTYFSDGGDVDPKSKVVYYGEPYGELPEPVGNDGGFFRGWYTNRWGRGTEITSESIVDLTSNITLYALWIYPVNPEWRTDNTIEYGDGSKAFFGFQSDSDYTDYWYEWYKCDKDGNNGVLVYESDTVSYHTPGDWPVGTYYFYVIITNTDKESGKGATARGPVIKLTIVPSAPKVDVWPEDITVDLSSGSNILGDYEILGATMKNRYSDAPVSGKFSWVDPTLEIKTSTQYSGETQKMQILFTPDDTTNYKPTTFNFDIEVLHAHNFVDTEEVTAATCTEKGKMKQKCSICWVTKTVTTPALGHDYEGGAWMTNETQHWKQCSRCDSTDTPADHTFGEWVGGKRTCEACGYEQAQLITVTITWSGMAFTYTDGAWDATAHDYMVGEWTAEEENGDRITVENTGEGEVTVSFVYTQDNDAVEGSFADEDGAAIESPVALPAGDKKYAWLCLSGKPERELNAETIGKVTVRLGGNT